MKLETKVPEDVSVQQFFGELLPKMFEEAKAQEAQAGDFPFTMTIDVDGQKWGVKTGEGNMEVKEGGMDGALITLVISEADWRDSVTGKIDMSGGMMDVQQMKDQAPQKLQVLQNLKGRMDLDIDKPDGGKFMCGVVFNGTEVPQATMNMKLDDYLKLNSGELNGQVAFMQGLMKIQGDMGLMMQLSALMM